VKKTSLFEQCLYVDTGFGNVLIHDSPYMKILSFGFKAGQSLPLHAHEIEGQVSIAVLSGHGEFLAKDGAMPAKAGDLLIADIAEPHGVRAESDMCVLVTIAPPI
jgi:quercetin dioxygenase-like cupin family protein